MTPLKFLAGLATNPPHTPLGPVIVRASRLKGLNMNTYFKKSYDVLANTDRITKVTGESAAAVIEREVRRQKQGHFNVASFTSIQQVPGAQSDNAHVQFDCEGYRGMAIYRADAPSPYI